MSTSSLKERSSLEKTGSKVKKKQSSPGVTLPRLPSTHLVHGLASSDPHRPLSVVELPHLIAQDRSGPGAGSGPGKARGDRKWTQGPQLMVSAVGAHIPIRKTTSSLTKKDQSITVRRHTDDDEDDVRKINTELKSSINNPLTGIEVVQILLQKRNPGDVEFYFLREVKGDSYRPYDLQVVDSSEAGCEHYVFSSSTVLHHTHSGCGGLMPLSDWFRECMLWTALQEISFYRLFRLRKAFTWWNKIIHAVIFQRKCSNLQDVMLMAVPPFRDAVYQLISVIEELLCSHWMPMDECKTSTLMDFKDAVTIKSQSCRHFLEKLSQNLSLILNSVRDECYQRHEELQKQRKHAVFPTRCREPIYLQLDQQRKLRNDLVESEHTLMKLGRFSALTHHMVIQALVSFIQQDALHFLNVLKVMKSQQRSVFLTELCFNTDDELTVEPSMHQFEQTLLHSISGSIIQMCEECGLFVESSSCVSGSAQDVVVCDCDVNCTGSSRNTGERTFDGRRTNDVLRENPSLRLMSSKHTVRGIRVRGCYSPLSKVQLQWQLSVDDLIKQAMKEQTEIIQEAQLEVHQLCQSVSWLADVHLFAKRWDQSSLSDVKHQPEPVTVYTQHILKLRDWAERMSTMDPTVSTSTAVFTVNCSNIKETLGGQLTMIEEQLMEQVKLCTETMISDLETTSAGLRAEPQGLHHFSKYTLMVRESMKTFSETQTQLENIRSLISAKPVTCGNTTEQQLTLNEKMQSLCSDFTQLLFDGNNLVSHRLPSMIHILDEFFGGLVCDFENVVTDATSEVFLDPGQNASEMVKKLNYMCKHLSCVYSKLQQLSENRQDLQGYSMDLTLWMADFHKVTARKELWELKAAFSMWLEEWKQLPFSEAAISQAQEKIAEWNTKAQSLTDTIPSADPILKENFRDLKILSHHLVVMAKLLGSTLKEKHWKAIFQDVGQVFSSDRNLTVADLMSLQSKFNQNVIDKICLNAQLEHHMEEAFQKLCQGWNEKVFQLKEYTSPGWQLSGPQNEATEQEKDTRSHGCHDDARFTVTGLELCLADVEGDLMTLSIMLNSPHSMDFRLQLNSWIEILRDLENLLNMFEKYQQMWAFLSKVVGEKLSCNQRKDWQLRFSSIDESFQKMMNSICADPHVLNFVSIKRSDTFFGGRLHQILSEGLSQMEVISTQMTERFDSVRKMYPRLYFLGEKEIVKLLCFCPTPSRLQHFVRKCFKGVYWLEVDYRTESNAEDLKICDTTCESTKQATVLGVFGSLQERITFCNPLEWNPDTLLWFGQFEKQLKLAMVQLLKQSTAEENYLPYIAERSLQAQTELDQLEEFPLQCMVVAEEVKWCSMVRQAFKDLTSVTLNNMIAQNSTKLNNLCHLLRNEFTGSKTKTKYTATCLSTLIQLTMNHARQLSQLKEAQDASESSFQWQCLLKYHIESDQGQDDGSALTCYIEAVGQPFKYGFEYYGPEDLVLVQTPTTDKAVHGILLALLSFRWGLMSGPSLSGKKSTALQLGKALGRQIVVMECCGSMTSSAVVQMLLGALQAEAWLVLDSVDLLTQKVLSVLGQHLSRIHKSFTNLKKKCNNEGSEDKTAITGSTVFNWQVELESQRISAIPYFGCVLISSKTYTSSFPGSLRLSTRPIALTHPDYKIIAEVKLKSFGFLDAKSLSQRLVSLIFQAKDSSSLPDFVTKHQSGYLDVISKILAATEIHFQKTARHQFCSTNAKSCNGHLSEDGETVQVSDQNSSHLSVIWGLIEETAIVKAIISVLMPAIEKSHTFYNLFKDTFPITCQFCPQQLIDVAGKKKIQNAVAEELEVKQLHYDTKIICSAVTLCQSLESSRAVILIGPPGSGKTTCYRVLTSALNSLAAKASGVLENYTMNKGEASLRETQISTSDCVYYHNLVLFPNAMSHEEMFGSFCEERGWQDGVLAKLLRGAEQHEYPSAKSCISLPKKTRTPVLKLLILDGELMEKPSWIDQITTMCNPQDPFLSLSSGETLSSPSNLKLLFETTHLSDVSPSAVTRCSLVYFTGDDLWKSVWKRELAILSLNNKLDHSVMKMWSRLGEDLFPSTLSLLKEKLFPIAMQSKRASCEKPLHGLQEITSFVRILHAVLQHFENEVKISSTENRDKPLHEVHTPGTLSQSQHQLLTRDIFLVAFVWGFGGHLNDSCWTQFDSIVRQVLFTSRYKILVPDDKNVFEHFFSIETKMCPNNMMLTTSITPKFGKYINLLNIMLKSNKPVLLAGETGCGKTTLCNTLLTDNKLHISLPVCSLLSPRNLCTVLKNINNRRSFNHVSQSTAKQPELLLFLDDLHEATCGEMTSMALETLRQSISMEEMIVLDNYCLKFLKSDSIHYLTTCNISGISDPNSKVISARLSRLFSIFVLPSLSLDMIFSMHSPRIKSWLTKAAFQCNNEELSNCIITATKNLYDTIHEQFQPTTQNPYFLLSHHDIHRVLCAMCLCVPDISNTPSVPKTETFLSNFSPALSEPPKSSLNVAHLWTHECARTFCDRLCTENERESLQSLIAQRAVAYFADIWVDKAYSDRFHGSHTVTGSTFLTLPTDSAHTCQKSLSLTDSQKNEVTCQAGVKNCCPRSERSSLPTSPLNRWYSEDVMTKRVFGPKLSKALIDKCHILKNHTLYQEQEVDAVEEELRDLWSKIDKNAQQKLDNDFCITSKYVVHRQGVIQLMHILRALLILGGHGVLIGSGRGTCRKTTVRLAAYLSGLQLVEIHPGNEKEIHQILKEVGCQARVGGVKFIILVHEEVSERVREEILTAMAQRSFPAVHTDNELRVLAGRATAANKSKSLKDIWRFEMFLLQSHTNVHVFLLMPSIASGILSNKKTQNTIAQLTKAVRLSCCVEVYQQWSLHSLQEVAAQCLKHNPQIKGLEASLSLAMAGIHQSTCQYASVLLKSQPFSPQVYVGLTAHFGYFHRLLQQNLHSKTQRLAAVLSQLDALNNTAAQCKAQLIMLQKKMEDTQQQEAKLLKAMDDQRNFCKEACVRCVSHEQKLCRLEEQISRAQETVKPVFHSALEALRCLNPVDLEEVKHYREPPAGVVKVMDALCLMFARPPGWESAKQLLGQSNFFQELEFFDRWSLTNEKLQHLEQIMNSPQFVPESVREHSRACESLCRWVQAVYQCCSQHQQLVLKQQWEQEARQARDHLIQAQLHKKKAYSRMRDTKTRLCLMQSELKEQQLQIHEAEDTEREASLFSNQAEFHRRRWKVSAQVVESYIPNVVGDALILAAVVSYLGPFQPDTRAELITKWKDLCRTGNIDVFPKDPRDDLFSAPNPVPPSTSLGFPIPVTERLQMPVSQALGLNEWTVSDSEHRLLVSLLLWSNRHVRSHRWPLLADAQSHQEICSKEWLLTGEKAGVKEETECDLVVSADDPQLLDKLRVAADTGLTVLVTQVERVIPSPEFLRILLRSRSIVHPNFCLFLSTHLPVTFLSNGIHPSILAQVDVFDLSLSKDETQELMLTQVLQSECRELLIQQLRLQNYNQLLQQKVFTEEEALMDYILHRESSLLTDSGFLVKAEICQKAIENVQADVQQLNVVLEDSRSLLAPTRQLMLLAANLYQALQEVSRRSPLYYFSLSGFIDVIKQAISEKGRALFSSADNDHVISLIENTMVVHVLEQYSPCFFRGHVLELQLLLSLALLQHNQSCTVAESSALLRGLRDLKRHLTEEKPWLVTALPTWINPHTHSELLCLDTIPPFRGLVASICDSPEQWQEYLRCATTAVTGSVPIGSHSHLSLVHRALLCKTIIPNHQEQIANAINTSIIPQFCKKTGADVPHSGNPGALSLYALKHKGPIIVIMADPRGNDETRPEPLYLINQLVHWAPGTKEVQIKVLSYEEMLDKQVVLSSLDRAVNEGCWLVFDDCHLMEQWDNEVVVKLSQMITFMKENCFTHLQQRLWFVTQQSSSNSLPAVVRMGSISVVSDSLKEDPRCS
ncbi:dynein heavy chain domain-containing protein 1 [Gouania willdenowi]|uniref:dynein heavy chain domain-containing protein 1 n=1 Tax=Gouania willdenowi TaxID=441366 RepID=UPI0010549D9F|nr:dynein heavy chain domain-containing protein 1 [Gouania willdenowi]